MAEPTDLDQAKEILFPGLTAEEQDRRMSEAFEHAADPERQQRIEQQATGAAVLKDAIGAANAPKLAAIEEYARRDTEITEALRASIDADPDFAAKLDAIRAERGEQGFPGVDTDPDEYEREIAADEQDIRADSLGL